MVVMTRDEAVPEQAIRAVEALLPPGTKVETFPGQPRVAVTFADVAGIEEAKEEPAPAAEVETPAAKPAK